MRERILILILVVAVATTGLASVATAGSTAGVQSEGAAVTFSNQTTGGDTVTVDSVTLPDGGYVTIHDASVTEGNVLGSVAGTSTYLEPGTHDNVTVSLIDEASDGTYVAMAHRETDGDRTYSFVSSNGETDGPYTADGSPVIAQANLTVSATVSMSDQPTNGENVVVNRAVLSEGGFVTIHDASVTEGAVFESIRGTSTYLEAGVHENVRVQLSEPLSENTTLVPMAHRDTDDDQNYTFDESEDDADGPYTNADGNAVIDTAAATVTDTASATFENQSSGGTAVSASSVYVPEGGFVTIHDASLTEGAVFDSVRGTSTYLEPGLHRDVDVMLDNPVSNDTTLIAMPHRDTNDNETYDFLTSEGANDGPYTADGSAVVDSANVTISASVDFSDQSSDGTTVVVDSVDLSSPGFVAIHDSTLLDGAVFDSVVGHSEYLEAGHHENVTVTLDTRQTDTQSLVAMPHMDTDGDTNYTFVESEGANDGPFTAGGNAVVDSAEVTIEASLAYDGQSGDGTTVTIPEVTLQDGGFVTIHDASVTEGAVFESIRGTSTYLSPGTQENVEIELDEPLTENATLVPMAHRDTDGDEAYTFPDSEGENDGPYVAAGGAIVTTGQYTVTSMDSEMTETESSEMTETQTEMMSGENTEEMMGQQTTEAAGDGTTTGSGPGFGVAVGLIALLGGSLIALRRHL
jgi:PGF-CTERM protein